MNKRLMFVLLSVLVTASMILAACAPAAEPTVGSPEHPIKVLFVPSVDANVIVTGGEVMAKALNEATG